jgi:hypothetical protein
MGLAICEEDRAIQLALHISAALASDGGRSAAVLAFAPSRFARGVPKNDAA